MSGRTGSGAKLELTLIRRTQLFPINQFRRRETFQEFSGVKQMDINGLIILHVHRVFPPTNIIINQKCNLFAILETRISI